MCCPGRTWDDASRRSRRPDDRHGRRRRAEFQASVLGRRVLSPLDLEREFGLVGGDIFHGALALDQLFSARPVLGQRRLPDADQGPVPVRIGRASRRRRHRHSGAQRRARDHQGRRKDASPPPKQLSGSATATPTMRSVTRAAVEARKAKGRSELFAVTRRPKCRGTGTRLRRRGGLVARAA